MTSDGAAGDCVARVRKNLTWALEHWNGSNPLSMTESEALLQQSAADLQRFEDALQVGMAPAVATRLELLDIKASIDRFSRIVDSASAFVAGIIGINADTGNSYDAAGAPRRVACGDTVCNGGQAGCRIF